MTRLEPGDFVGFSASDTRARTVLNNSDAPAVIYTTGTNPPDDEVVFAWAGRSGADKSVTDEPSPPTRERGA